MSANAKKPGGLGFNPLLARTDCTDGPADAPADTPARQHVNTREETSKFTFYFTPAQLERLDRVWLTFRRQARGSKRRVTKSQIVRLAVDRLLDDVERRPEEVFAALRRLTEERGDADD